MKQIQVLLFILLFAINTNAQHQNETDSLELILKEKKLNDTVRLKISSKLLRIYSDYDSLKTVFYFQKTLSLAKKTNNTEYLSSAYYNCGIMYLYSGYPNKARELFKSQLNISSKKNYVKGKAKSMQGLGMVNDYTGETKNALKNFMTYLQYSKTSKDSSYIASAYQSIAMAYGKLGEYDNSLMFALKSLAIQKKLNVPKNIAITHNGIGTTYYATGNYPKALEHYLQALEINNKIDFKKGKSRNYNNIGIIHFEQEEYKQALEYFKKALSLKSKLNDEYGKAYTLSRIGEVYNFTNKKDSALTYLNKAIVIRTKIGDLDGVATSYMQIGNLLMKQKEYKAATDSLKKSLNIYKQIDRKPGICAALLSLGQIENEKENYKKAIPFLVECEQLSQSVNEFSLKRDLSQSLAKAYSKTGNYKKAYEYYVIYKQVSDSIFNEKNTKKITQQLMQYEFDREKAKIHYQNSKNELLKENELRNQRILSYIYISLIGVVVLILILLYRNNRIKQKTNKILNRQKKEIQEQAEELTVTLVKITKLTEFREDMTQMMIHDLKNPLNALMNLPKALSPYDKRQIRKYSAQKMHNLIINILDVRKYEETELKIFPTTISINKLWDKALTEQQYMIEQKNIEINNTAKNEIFIEADKELTDRTISNILSNALKYTPSNGKISLTYKELDDTNCMISISDNGYGIPEEKLPSIFKKYIQSGKKVKYSTGIGLTFCKIAIEKHGGEIGIESEEGQGTTVWFTLPKSKSIVSGEESTRADKKISLSTKEKLYLSELFSKFDEPDLSEISAFRKIFKNIEEENTVNNNWLDAYKKSVYHRNQKEYNKLKNMFQSDI